MESLKHVCSCTTFQLPYWNFMHNVQVMVYSVCQSHLIWKRNIRICTSHGHPTGDGGGISLKYQPVVQAAQVSARAQQHVLHGSGTYVSCQRLTLCLQFHPLLKGLDLGFPELFSSQQHPYIKRLFSHNFAWLQQPSKRADRRKRTAATMLLIHRKLWGQMTESAHSHLVTQWHRTWGLQWIYNIQQRPQTSLLQLHIACEVILCLLYEQHLSTPQTNMTNLPLVRWSC